MKGVAKPRATRSQIVFAIQVLKHLRCYINNEAEEAAWFTGKWHLERARADRITTRGVQRMESVDTVICDLKQWTFALANSSRTTTHGNPSTND